MNIKKNIENKYGTINRFLDAVQTSTKLSRTHLYKLINDPKANPTVASVMELSTLIGMNPVDVFGEFCERHLIIQRKERE